MQPPKDEEFVSGSKKVIEAFLIKTKSAQQLITNPVNLPDLEDLVLIDNDLPQ